MSQHDDIDDARAALIDKRISQSFAFLGDVIDEPHLLDSIPDAVRGLRFAMSRSTAANFD